MQLRLREDQLFVAERPLTSSHVYHLNGSAEAWGDQSRRSKFILEDDSYTAVAGCLEGDEAFTKLAWNDITVIVGMSFECEADRFFLHCLSRVEDDLPIGKSHFIVVNMDQSAAKKIEHKILNALPRASVASVISPFEKWVSIGMPELKKLGALS